MINNKLTGAIIVGAISAIECELPHLKKTKGENHPLVALYAVCGTALAELQEYRNAQPVAWTDAQELQDAEKDGCGYLFKANPVTPHADPRRVIKLYTAPQPLADAERAELQEYRNAAPVVLEEELIIRHSPWPTPQPLTEAECTKLLATASQAPVFIPSKAVKIPVLPDYVFHTMAVRWPLSAEQIKRLCRELQLEMEKHHEQA